MHHLHRDTRDVKFNLSDEDDDYPNKDETISSSIIPTLVGVHHDSNGINSPSFAMMNGSGSETKNTCNSWILASIGGDMESTQIQRLATNTTSNVNNTCEWNIVSESIAGKDKFIQHIMSDCRNALELDKDKREIAFESNDERDDESTCAKGTISTLESPTDTKQGNTDTTIPISLTPNMEMETPDCDGVQSTASTSSQQRDQPKRMTKRLRLESLQAYMTPEQKEEQKKKLRGNFEDIHEKVKVVKKRAPRKDFWHQVKSEEPTVYYGNSSPQQPNNTLLLTTQQFTTTNSD